MSTLEDRRHDAEQDRIADDRHELALFRAMADKGAVVAGLFSALEAGEVTAASDGGWLFDTTDGLSVSLVFDDARDGNAIDATLWTDDETGDPVELATVRLTAEVLS